MSPLSDSTLESVDEPDEEKAIQPGSVRAGLVLLFSAGRPMLQLLPVGQSTEELGRSHPIFAGSEDPMLSRRHASIAYHDGRFALADLGSRNGSALDGQYFTGAIRAAPGQVLRIGHSLFLLCRSLSPYSSLGVHRQDGRIEGPALQQAMRTVVRLAEHSRMLFVVGETGAGKESLAQAFHRAGPQRRGPFVAVNCATIPEGVAERLLFGAQKGAYSGAGNDSEGYVQAAHGGTLFLDEIADLDATVQAKLLRAIESGEVMPLGATRPRKVEMRVCSATHKDLRALVAAGTFRADLYFRLGMPQLKVPPLRERREEIAWHAAAAAARVAPELKLDAHLVEACLLRTWPGNVRELHTELHTAAVNALSTGSAAVNLGHLNPAAGTALAPPAPAASLPPPTDDQGPAPDHGGVRGSPPTRSDLVLALVAAKGNISAAARALGLYRNQLRRYMTRHRIDLVRLLERDHA